MEVKLNFTEEELAEIVSSIQNAPVGGFGKIDKNREVYSLPTKRLANMVAKKLNAALNEITDAIQSLEAEKGQPNGVATLGADGKVPSDQLPAGQGGFDVNIENGTGKSSVQQLPDGVKDGFDFTGKNPNATALDDTLTGIIPYGATGDFASSFGGKSAAMGKRSHAEGTTTIAKGKYSHVEGDNSVALGDDSHAEGNTTVSKGNGSHSEGRLTTASGDFSHAEGLENNADAYSTHAEGVKTQAMAEGSHTEGYATVTNANFSHAEGTYSQTGAGAEGAHAEGNRTNASAPCSHAEGNHTQAFGFASHAEGNNTQATGSYSHAGGCDTIASGNYSYAEGNKTQATGGHSHAAGYNTIASGDCAYADGNATSASGNHSHASGYKTKATVAEQYAVGRWNKENDNALLIVGCGTSEDDRKNSFEALFDGRAKVYGEPKEPEDVVRLKELRAMGSGMKLYTHRYNVNFGNNRIGYVEFISTTNRVLCVNETFADGSSGYNVPLNITSDKIDLKFKLTLNAADTFFPLGIQQTYFNNYQFTYYDHSTLSFDMVLGFTGEYNIKEL